MSWVGRLEGQPLSNVVLVIYDGVLTGSVVWPEGAYRIAFDGRRASSSSSTTTCSPRATASATSRRRGRRWTSARRPADTGALVDVLVVYTPAARAAAGGTAGMISLVNTAVAETNTGYANSGVVQRLRLAGTVELSYTEADAGTDLDRVTDTNDGYMDSVHALRDTYKADEVVLIGEGYARAANLRRSPGSWQGNNPGFAPNAFAVVDRTCATGYYSFGHELGHNMGLNHAREDYAGTPTGAYPYSFGYKWTGYRTVMAYAPGTRILYFSNPNVQYLGNPTGVSEAAGNSANNALSLNNTRVTVANWRRPRPPPSRSTCPTAASPGRPARRAASPGPRPTCPRARSSTSPTQTGPTAGTRRTGRPAG